MYAKQVAKLTNEQITQYLESNTFFNPFWTEAQAKDALVYTYNQALLNGVYSGTYSTQYLGETVTVALNNGLLKTGFGNYSFTLEQFIALFGR